MPSDEDGKADEVFLKQFKEGQATVTDSSGKISEIYQNGNIVGCGTQATQEVYDGIRANF